MPRPRDRSVEPEVEHDCFALSRYRTSGLLSSSFLIVLIVAVSAWFCCSACLPHYIWSTSFLSILSNLKSIGSACLPHFVAGPYLVSFLIPHKSIESIMCKCISGIITLITLAVVGVLLWNFLGRPETVDEAMQAGGDLLDQAADVLKDFDWSDFDFGQMFENEGKYDGASNETLTWDFGAESRNGLKLTLKNNLDETWQEEYSQAIQNWMDSDPLILLLETEPTDACKAEEGVMVVCNGNHGDNGMLGFNDLVFSKDGIIYSSVATMNEYYLQNADWAERLYTMCHELGHGLGLPHTDEDPYNTDTYNCMDYTDNPENNMLPGQVNFSRLQEIYGTVSRRRLGHPSSTTASTTGGRFPDNLQQSYEEALSDLKQEISSEYMTAEGASSTEGSSGWRKLHKNEHGARYVRDLVDGYSVEVSVLHPRRE